VCLLRRFPKCGVAPVPDRAISRWCEVDLSVQQDDLQERLHPPAVAEDTAEAPPGRVHISVFDSSGVAGNRSGNADVVVVPTRCGTVRRTATGSGDVRSWKSVRGVDRGSVIAGTALSQDDPDG
jgi:hypothetical protein